MNNRRTVRTFDLFCGAGGSSWGARLAGAEIVGGLDADRIAIETFRDNFPNAIGFHSRSEEVDPADVCKQVGRVDLLLASPECTNHTCAKGNGVRSEDSRMTAFEVLRFAEGLRPQGIVIENVVHMRSWSRYREFLQKLKELGYKTRELVLNSADFGVPQSRRRLIILAKRTGEPPDAVAGGTQTKWLSIRGFLSFNGQYPFKLLTTPNRAKATLKRAERAKKAIGPGREFLLVYYGSDAAGGWQALDRPLRTVTTIDRFALVKKDGHRYVMRMLQVDEIRAAMGFDTAFSLMRGTRRDKIRLLGNAVCPPLMAAVVRQLIGTTFGADGSTHG